MNDKASVSKELNAKHAKLLLGLLKLPENKQCADCWSKAPRWASINLGVFICMQCSGIHRSLGVHISKVRSTTLDTWLPEQVAFMQVMGNERSNEYWEAELPPDFDRNPIEKFIHDKYVERKWASTTSPQPTPEICLDKSAGTCKIPKKARKYSLDEEFFTKEMPQIDHPTRSRAGSFDLMNEPITPPPINVEDNTSSPNVNRDLFSLLYVSEDKDRTVVPPSRWATFESDASIGEDLFYLERFLHCIIPCSSGGKIFEELISQKWHSIDPNIFWTLILQTKIVLRCVRPYDAIIHSPLSSNLRRPKFDKLFFFSSFPC